VSDRRSERFSGGNPPDKADDHRDEFQRDCDRLLYSGAFRRLAVITQVVSPAGGHAFHNRLTHVLKVAQIGRRVAERLNIPENTELIAELGGLSPSVVEAAGMAHDLGHPPFGHIAEEELNEGLLKAGEAEGYEGNAQSFRIVTRLDIRESGRGSEARGLNLTRATLNAVLKYPSLRPLDKTETHPKFGTYRAEEKQFNFARDGGKDGQRSLEADVMDWADDITYAVHDLEDFYRAGMIPLDRLAYANDEVKAFIAGMARRLNKLSKDEFQLYEDTASRFLKFSPVAEPYTGRRTQRAALRGLASSIIHRAVSGTTLSREGLVRPSNIVREVAILKQLTWHYVIEDSRLAAEQHGKRRVIRELFEIFCDAATNKARQKLFPIRFQEQLEDGECTPPRTAADYIADMGEQRAVELYNSLTGSSLKPVTTGLTL
jgi:dGTPase